MPERILRELSLMDFNARVLALAQDPSIPLGERCRFAAITESNTDEVMMVRLAGLISDSLRGRKRKSDSAALQLKGVRNRIREFGAAQQQTAQILLDALRDEGIHPISPQEMNTQEQQSLEENLRRDILPRITKMEFRSRRRPPHLPGRKTILILRESSLCRVFILSSHLPKVITLKDGRFLITEEAVLWLLMRDYACKGALCLRILRDEDLDYDEYASDWMEEMERSLRRRGWGRPVALQYHRNLPRSGYDPMLVEMLREAMHLPRAAVYGKNCLLHLGTLTQAGGALGQDAFYPPFTPREPIGEGGVMALMETRDLLVHVPYESYDPVLTLLREAAQDDDITSIAQTLYRVSDQSPVVQALMSAAQAGKNVTVLVELKARFDEEHNIHWAQLLEEAGCRVIDGVQGLKVHGKALLIEKRDGRRYLHLGTGNYNEDTARAYSDMHLFTTDKDLCQDAQLLFQSLGSGENRDDFSSLIVAPQQLRPFLYEKIDREIEAAQQGRPAWIRAKMNGLSDPGIADKLCEASCAGVRVELVVRGVCTLIPGVPNVSENIRVLSIVGRYLEHHRIYEFCADGQEEVYLSSADWMPRNLNRRVEIAFPVRDAAARRRLHVLLQVALSDNTHAWELRPDGKWLRVENSDPEVDFQAYCMEEEKTLHE